ncbi:XRE family transcriptional regulator [Rhizobium laguerreae]|uniref:XRE family transcriptional regulator n=1 Tax=Rhizobium laguerreae TaxID=1076926 RepID=UPI001C905B89|nr:XRE family transcriptional regulator [Rhizobium laguerreae]MBY3038900.1 ImmA/IrrE family metallo-endopeptidase [Rhizobium laguerreae]MBY3226878.1 ImmA/IrrE family metallo-endopeptidase [Rhizobium laguerreae]
MSTIEKLASDRGVPLAAIAEITGISEGSIRDQTVDNYSAKEIDAIAAILGVDSATLYAKSDVAVRKIPSDFRTVNNDEFLLNKYSLNAIYNVYSIIEYIKNVEKDLKRNSSKEIEGFIPKSKDPRSILASLADIFEANADFFEDKNDEYEIFNILRYRLEDKGVYVICERVDDNSFKGFCVNYDDIRVVFINTNSQSLRSRIFTLVHEVVHILLNVPGIGDPYLGRREQERSINSITANYLVSSSIIRNLAEAYGEIVDPVSFVNYLGEKLPFSKYFLAIRASEVLDRQKGLARSWLEAIGVAYPHRSAIQNPNFFNAINNEDRDSSEDPNAFQPRHTSASYQVARLGFSLLALAEIATNTRTSTKFDLKYFLNIPPKNYEKVISSFHRKRNEVSRNAST